MANTWLELLNRYGFVTTQNGLALGVKELSKENRKYLQLLLKNADVHYQSLPNSIEILGEVIDEEKWQEVQGNLTDGITEMSFNPDELPVIKLDLFIAGLVSQFIRLDLPTIYSCDGHDKRMPNIHFINAEMARKAEILLKHLNINCHRRGKKLSIRINRKKLPLVAGTLSKYTDLDVKTIMLNSDSRISIDVFNDQLETLLNIPGESRRESKIRNHVLKEMIPYIDFVTTDFYGNILAEKRFGSGPTVILNAHLDTVEKIKESRTILKEENIWTSTEGILGADDRAGINVILATLKSLQSNEFNGTLKIIFTVEEEIGLVGARKVNESFLWNTEMAFVIDRRGTNDIVTHNNSQEFCNHEFGLSLERIANTNELGPWKSVRGGSSDTSIWASHNIQSVNLSAGYLHEHTDFEQLDVDANYNSYLFLKEILINAQRIWSEQRKSLTKYKSNPQIKETLLH
ncbi:M20/M25/M40 family metallo-hydrolase [Paenisporosarcina quisquiliarum]|uniref:M20/M25/M40 family metallo-hydrolase n=1 Tax=Paenisporosarcina quisquiliarum TaxID=365346 RepID=UPI003734D4A2